MLKPKKTLFQHLTSGYLVIVRDEENFAEKATFRLNFSRIITLLVLLFACMSALSMWLATSVLARWFDPRLETLQANRILIELEQKVDSLDRAVHLSEQHFTAIRNIMDGRVSYMSGLPEADNMPKVSEVEDLRRISETDSLFRKEFEEADYARLVARNTTRQELQQMFLFPPINGLVTRGFDIVSRHYGTDIVSKKDEPVKSVADGTVIFASWTQDAGNVIALQHKNRLISIYKHNSVLLKKAGETVRTGDMIAIVGNSGELTDGPHLHFELWYNGNPVNPEEFISF